MPTRRELPNGWEKTTLKYLYHADTFTRSSLIRHLRTFSRTPYGHKHGWDTLATQCGRSTPSHAPTEHGTRPTTTWDGYGAEETMHSTAQPRQHASDCTQQAQTHTVRRAPTSTSKRRPHRHVQACCKGFRAAAARRARRASDPSRSDPQTRTSRELQANLPTAELQAPRREKRLVLQLSRMELMMSSRPSGWPMRSNGSPTAAETTCGRRAEEVSQACRHVAGGEASEPQCTFLKNGEEFFNRTKAGRMEMRRLHAAIQVAPYHSLHGARKGTLR